LALASCVGSRSRETSHEFVQSNECERMPCAMQRDRGVQVTRERICISILGESVDVELSEAARDHLAAAAERQGLPSLSALVQALVVCAAYPQPPRAAAERARMRYARWVAAVCLAATGYSALGTHIARAQDALRATAGDSSRA
jgi:hypothetical protein